MTFGTWDKIFNVKKQKMLSLKEKLGLFVLYELVCEIKGVKREWWIMLYEIEGESEDVRP